MSLKKKMSELREVVIDTINSINRYTDQFVVAKSGTDPFGTVTIASSGDGITTFKSYYAVALADGFKGSNSQRIFATVYAHYADLTIKNEPKVLKLKQTRGKFYANDLSCLILPETFGFTSSFVDDLVDSEDCNLFKRGLYLPKHTVSNTSNWIYGDVQTLTESVVRCPEGTDTLPYLVKLNITSDSLSAIIRALATVTASNIYMQVGSTNIAKISDEDVDLLMEKGWKLS